MTREVFKQVEAYMLSCMKDSAHDCHHVYRVLNTAIDLAQHYDIDEDVLIAAALLHDIGRNEQNRDNTLDHAEIGAQKAYDFLVSLGWKEEKASHVKSCIYTHRYRSNAEPDSIEAKIIFDSDKIEVTGAIGIARTLYYGALHDEPLYRLDEDGIITYPAEGAETQSFVEEYNWKLRKIYDSFYTEHAKKIAAKNKKAGDDFYHAILNEVDENRRNAAHLLSQLLN